MYKLKNTKTIICFVFSFLLFKNLMAQAVNFEINKVCIDTPGIDQDGLNHVCVSFLIKTKNMSLNKKNIFKDTILGGDLNFGRLIFFDAVKKKFYYSLITPLLDIGDKVSNFEVEGNDSAVFTAVIYLSNLFEFYKYRNINKIKGELYTRLIQNGSLFYLPGEYRKVKKASKSLPREAIEIKQKKGIEILYNNTCLTSERIKY